MQGVRSSTGPRAGRTVDIGSIDPVGTDSTAQVAGSTGHSSCTYPPVAVATAAAGSIVVVAVAVPIPPAAAAADAVAVAVAAGVLMVAPSHLVAGAVGTAELTFAAGGAVVATIAAAVVGPIVAGAAAATAAATTTWRQENVLVVKRNTSKPLSDPAYKE